MSTLSGGLPELFRLLTSTRTANKSSSGVPDPSMARSKALRRSSSNLGMAISRDPDSTRLGEGYVNTPLNYRPPHWMFPSWWLDFRAPGGSSTSAESGAPEEDSLYSYASPG